MKYLLTITKANGIDVNIDEIGKNLLKVSTYHRFSTILVITLLVKRVVK